jgi:hypothetical protein
MEEIVRQVVYLPELYKDARSEKYLKKVSTSLAVDNTFSDGKPSKVIPTAIVQLVAEI